MRGVWPSGFEYKEEIALQFLSEVLLYRVSDLSQMAEKASMNVFLTAYLNDLRLANRSHATLTIFHKNIDKKTEKLVISP